MEEIKDLKMKYLVLKMDDDIDVQYLIDKLQSYKKLRREEYYTNIPVSKIGVHLINSILRNK
jgi:hypothetical protein